jgi:hypothetical protein
MRYDPALLKQPLEIFAMSLQQLRFVCGHCLEKVLAWRDEFAEEVGHFCLL